VPISPSRTARRAPARSVSQGGLRRRRWLALHWPLSEKRRLLPRIGCSIKLRLIRHDACPLAPPARTRRAGAQLQAPRTDEGRRVPLPRPSSSSLVVQNTDCSEAARLARRSSWPGLFAAASGPGCYAAPVRRGHAARRAVHHRKRAARPRRARLQKGKRHPKARARGQAPATSAAHLRRSWHALGTPTLAHGRCSLPRRRTGSLVSGAALSAAADSPDHLQAPRWSGRSHEPEQPRERSECETCDAGGEGDSARGARLACEASAQDEDADVARRLSSVIETSKRRDTTASKQRRAGGGAVKHSQGRTRMK
jgi:hypothetical protein